MRQNDNSDRARRALLRETGAEAQLVQFVPGRVELIGNHTDHQHGCTVAAAVTVGMTAAAAKRSDGVVRIMSPGFDAAELSLNELAIRPEERGTSAALVRGIAAWFCAHGYSVGGFDAHIYSEVPPGSGLSSSAAFEVSVAGLMSRLYNGGALDATELAHAGYYAENEYFGKPSGMMDQLTCASGGVAAMDFADPKAPVLKKIDVSFADFGYTLAVTDTHGSHAGLTEKYAQLPADMRAAAAAMGKTVLRECAEAEFMAEVPELRQKCGDRAVLRAFHFFRENARAQAAARCLGSGDIGGFLALMHASGESSFSYLGNVYCEGGDGSLAVALMLSDGLLCGRGAWRINGGGFAGTIVAAVPQDICADYVRGLDAAFGAGSCRTLDICPHGAVTL